MHLGHRQQQVLSILAAEMDGIHLAEIARRTGMDTGNTKATLDRLQNNNYIAKAETSKGRIKPYFITESGRDVLNFMLGRPLEAQQNGGSDQSPPPILVDLQVWFKNTNALHTGVGCIVSIFEKSALIATSRSVIHSGQKEELVRFRVEGNHVVPVELQDSKQLLVAEDNGLAFLKVAIVEPNSVEIQLQHDICLEDTFDVWCTLESGEKRGITGRLEWRESDGLRTLTFFSNELQPTMALIGSPVFTKQSVIIGIIQGAYETTPSSGYIVVPVSAFARTLDTYAPKSSLTDFEQKKDNTGPPPRYTGPITKRFFPRVYDSSLGILAVTVLAAFLIPQLWQEEEVEQSIIQNIQGDNNYVIALKASKQEHLTAKNTQVCQQQVIQGNNNLLICLTLIDYRDSLTQQLKDIQTQITGDGSGPAQALLQQQQNSIKSKLRNIHEAYTTHVRELQELIVKIDGLQHIVSQRRVEDAKRAIRLGNAEKALTLLAKAEEYLRQRLADIADKEKKAQEAEKQRELTKHMLNEQATDTAYEQGRIEENKFQFKEAMSHYLRAIGYSPKHTKSLISAGRMAQTLGKYEQAIDFCQKALNSGRALSEDHSLEMASAYDVLSMTWREKGNYDRAIELAQQALALRQKTLEEEHPDLAQTYDNIGSALEEKGKYDQAITFHEQALAIQQKSLGNDHPSLANTYNNLGICWARKGDNDRAIGLFEQALTLRLKILGDNHPLLNMPYNNLGVAWYNKGEYRKAISFFERGLKIKQSSFGEDHPVVATSYRNLGAAWSMMGEYDQAIALYTKSIEVSRKTLGENHPSLGDYYNNLGNAWLAKGAHDRAIELFEQAIEIKRLSRGEDHPSLANSYKNLGKAWSAKGAHDRAIELYQTALQLFRKTLGEDHYSVAESYNRLGNAWFNKGMFDRAIERYAQASVLIHKGLGDEHPELAESYHGLGEAWKAKGANTKALEYFKQALQIRQKKLGEDHHYTRETKQAIRTLQQRTHK